MRDKKTDHICATIWYVGAVSVVAIKLMNETGASVLGILMLIIALTYFLLGGGKEVKQDENRR